MVETVLPDVYIDVRPEGLIVPARISVGTVAVLGTASRGPIEKPVTVADFPTARALFGPPDDGTALTLTRALQLVFANGATSVLALRVAGRNAKGEITATSATYPVASADGRCAQLQAATEGSWGNDVQVQITPATDNAFVTDERHLGNEPHPITLRHHPIVPSARNRIQRFDDATGITHTLTIVDETKTPGPGQVKVVNATGVLDFGDAVDAADTVTASYLVDASSAVKVAVAYRGPAGAETATFTVLDGNDLVAQVNAAGSALVAATVGDRPEQKPKTTADTPSPTQGWAAFQGGEDAAADVDYQFGLDVLLSATAHIVVAAGQDQSVAAALAAHCATASTDARKRDRIAVVGSGSHDDLDTLLGHQVNSDRVVFVAPGIVTTDGTALPGSYAAAAVAGLIAGLPAHVSPTNKPLLVRDVGRVFSAPELAQLVQDRILALESRNGPRIVRGVTTSTNSAWTQITTRRIVDYAKYGVRSAAEPYIGLLNNTRVRAALRATVNSFLTGMVDAEMLVSYQLDVAATRAEELQGIARVTIVLRPVFSIEYIQITMFLQ